MEDDDSQTTIKKKPVQGLYPPVRPEGADVAPPSPAPPSAPKGEKGHSLGQSGALGPLDGAMRGKKRTRGVHLTPQERDSLMLKIQEGTLAGISSRTMMKELGIGKATFYRLLDQLSQETKKERLAKSQRLLHAYYTRIERTLADLDHQASQADDPKTIAAIKTDRATIINQAFDRLQSAGFLPKRTDRLEVEAQVEITTWLKKMLKKVPEGGAKGPQG